MDKVSYEREEKELVDLAPQTVLLIRKEKTEKRRNTKEIMFYIQSMYSTHTEELRTLIF